MCEISGTNPYPTERLRGFIIKRYLKISNFDDAKSWDIKSAEYALSFESLATIPSNELSRDTRPVLANRILQVVQSTDMDSLSNVSAHLNILQNLVQQPSKSMWILTNTEVTIKRVPQRYITNEIALLAIAQDIDNLFPWSIDNVDCIEALEQLARRVLRWVHHLRPPVLVLILILMVVIVTFSLQRIARILSITFEPFIALLRRSWNTNQKITIGEAPPSQDSYR